MDTCIFNCKSICLNTSDTPAALRARVVQRDFVSHADATSECNAHGLRACRVHELQAGRCCRHGCAMDHHYVWSGDECSIPHDKPRFGTLPRPRAVTSQSELLPRAFYINLDRRPDRMASFELEMKRAGWPAERVHRVSAVNSSTALRADAADGCLASHIYALQLARSMLPEHYESVAAVFEDDVGWLGDARLARRAIAAFADPLARGVDWDVLLLACFGRPSDRIDTIIRQEQPGVSTPRVARIEYDYCLTTAAYLIKWTYIPTLLKTWKRSLEKRRFAKQRGATRIGHDEADWAWRPLQCRDRFFLSVPKLVAQKPSYSDLRLKRVSYGF